MQRREEEAGGDSRVTLTAEVDRNCKCSSGNGWRSQEGQNATGNAVATVIEDIRSVATKVDAIEEELSARKKLLEKTNSRMERVEVAIQAHAKKIQQMEEEMANTNCRCWDSGKIDEEEVDNGT